MTIHINNPELEEQLEKFARESGQNLGVLANNLLKQGFDLYKNNPRHITETLSRWSDYEKTGETISNEEVMKYTQSLRTK